MEEIKIEVPDEVLIAVHHLHELAAAEGQVPDDFSEFATAIWRSALSLFMEYGPGLFDAAFFSAIRVAVEGGVPEAEIVRAILGENVAIIDMEHALFPDYFPENN